jgi:Flp pilus assembly protein TadG
MRRWWAGLRADRRGGAVLEFAIVGPVLLTILLGVVEMGRMFYIRHALEYATGEAARYYMINPTATQDAVTAALRAAMAGGMGSSISTPIYNDTVNCNGSPYVICTTITATYNYMPVAAFLHLGTSALTARAQAVRLL